MIKKIKKIVKKNFTKNYWQSDISSKWHNKRKDESYDDFKVFAHATAEKVKDLNFDTVIEVGTGAGTLINLISQYLNSYKRFIGIDINKQQIDRNIKTYKELDKVEFIYIDIEKYINDNNFNNVVIVAQNTFDYFKKEDLEKLFSLIYSKVENIAIVVSASKNNMNIDDSIDRKEADLKVYHHNYCSLLSSAGYKLMNVDLYTDNEDSVIVTGYKNG